MQVVPVFRDADTRVDQHADRVLGRVIAVPLAVVSSLGAPGERDVEVAIDGLDAGDLATVEVLLAGVLDLDLTADVSAQVIVTHGRAPCGA